MFGWLVHISFITYYYYVIYIYIYIILYYIYIYIYIYYTIYIYILLHILLHILCVYIISADLLLSPLYACIIDCPHPDTVQVGSLQMWVCLTPLQVIDVGRARVVWRSQMKDSSIWIPGWSFEIIIQQAVFSCLTNTVGL